jgi:hypothetical protein
MERRSICWSKAAHLMAARKQREEIRRKGLGTKCPLQNHFSNELLPLSRPHLLVSTINESIDYVGALIIKSLTQSSSSEHCIGTKPLTHELL